MSKFNGLLSTNGSGAYRVQIISISMDIKVVSHEDEGRSRRGFYPANTNSTAFGLGIIFPSWEKRERFNSWMRTFMDNTVDSRGFKAAIRVDCPPRKFARSAIPVGPLMYGEAYNDVTYPVLINFVGANDPLEINDSTRKVRSYFKPPQRGNQTAKFFYPAGKQMQGAANLDGAVYGPQIPANSALSGIGEEDPPAHVQPNNGELY